MQLPNLDSLPSMFERSVQGRTLILDADGLCYQAASTVKRLETALTRFQTLVATEMFVTGAEFVEIHLTPSGCTKCRRFDYPTNRPYQAQRTGPKPPLLQPLRDSIPRQEWPDNWSVYSWQDREADDGMIMHGVRHGDNGIILSADKDLRLTAGPYWEIEEGRLDVIPDRYGYIRTKELTSTTKVIGHGTRFYWCQMLMGDSADNVKGLLTYDGRSIGPVGAYNLLKDVSEEGGAAELVLAAYGKINQDPLAEAQCLWLRRSDEDCAYKYISELGLQPRYQQWLDDLQGYHEQWLAMRLSQRQEARYDAMC